MKRAVRVGIFDKKAHTFIANSAQIPIHPVTGWVSKKPDEWYFNSRKEIGLNPILFRSTVESELKEEEISIIFEFVIYLRTFKNNRKTISETSCGWAEFELKDARRDHKGMKLEVHGGSPLAAIAIKEQERKEVAKRGGVKGFFGISGSNKSYLSISVKQERMLEEDIKLHLTMLPAVCIVHKHLIHFISGFRNYAGKILLKESTLGQFRKPGGNIAISSFPAIIDNPDIIEQFVTCWYVDVMKPMKSDQKRSF